MKADIFSSAHMKAINKLRSQVQLINLSAFNWQLLFHDNIKLRSYSAQYERRSHDWHSIPAIFSLFFTKWEVQQHSKIFLLKRRKFCFLLGSSLVHVEDFDHQPINRLEFFFEKEKKKESDQFPFIVTNFRRTRLRIKSS